MSPTPNARTATRAATACLMALLVAACSTDGDDGATDARDVDAVRARARAMAYTVRSDPQWGLARAELAPLVERPDAEPDDLLRAALVEYHALDDERAAELLARAGDALDDDLGATFLRALLQSRDLRYEEAVATFEELLEADPSDLPARVLYAFNLEYVDRVEDANAQFERIRALGLEANASIYITACYRLSQNLRRDRTPAGIARYQALEDEVTALKARGLEPMKDSDVENSSHGRVRGPVARTISPGAPAVADLPSLTERAGTDVVSLDGHTELAAIDVDADGDRDLLAWGIGGAAVVLQDGDVWVPVTIADSPTARLTAADLDESAPNEQDHPHPALELLAIGTDGAARLFTWDGSTYRPLGDGALVDEGATDGVFVDHDHDGDTDVVLATSAGVAFFRNDGTVEQRDRTLVADPVDAATALGALTDVLIEDVDGDEDVDIVALSVDGTARVLSNERRHRWRDASEAWGANRVRAIARGLFLADLDGDAVPDWLAVDDDGGLTWHRGLGAGVFDGEAIATSGAALVAPQLVDVDADGHLDLYEQGRVLAGPLVRRDGPIVASDFGPTTHGVVTDLDGDSTADVATLGADGALAVSHGTGGGAAFTLVLDGRKDNRNGIGVVVDVYAGLSYQRLFARGDALTIGLGDEPDVDVLRVAWPNGVVQRGPFDVAAGDRVVLEQTEGLQGSCPFLYTWNGETFTFISDVLGTTPLGLPIAPGVTVPFDHEEYVLVRGDQLVPRDGRLDIAVTEELREVTYLDHLRLHAIDHPADVEVQPDEGFVFPPFPPHHVHTLRDVHAPTRAVSADGFDITELVAEEDGRFGAVYDRTLTQYYGLTEPWTLELDFAGVDAAALADAERLRLAITGWFLWTNASVNMAAARHPTISFDVPQLWVPDGSSPSGWRAAGPPIGFPAGKTKTQIVDVTDLLVRDDPRLRITSTLALSYDALRLAIDADDAPFVDTPLPAITADVSWRGFSRPFESPGGGPELFDWDELDGARWDQHPGRYTRYGDVTPLLDDVDDRTVIFGAGDVVFASFDATALPELPDGWTRSYLVYFDGWAKDRDPNTIAAERVEPLPFHGMTTYPPERPFPSSPELDAWREEYNTRPARVLRHRHPAVEAALLELSTPSVDE